METTKMEGLVKSMQEMFKKVKTDDESDKYLFFSPKYNPKVKVSEWLSWTCGPLVPKATQMDKLGLYKVAAKFVPKLHRQHRVNLYLPLESEPKDNNPYKPPGGDYFLSTYKRLGTQADPDELESETHAMLRQVCCVQPVRSHHQSLVNLDTDSLLRKDIPTVPSDRHLFGQNDFTTTYEYDYRHPYPYKKTASRLEIVKKPEKTFKLASVFSPSKICETKFLDDKFYSGRSATQPQLSHNATNMCKCR